MNKIFIYIVFLLAKKEERMYNMSINSNYLNIYGGDKMIIMNLKLNNIFSFKKFEVNFSYPKRVKNSLLSGEALEEFPSFRYKKLNIFIGSNASGKTSLIRTIWYILMFINKKESNAIEQIVDGNFEESEIVIDFVDSSSNDTYLHRLSIKTNNVNLPNIDIAISHKKTKLLSNSTYENAVIKLNNIKTIYRNYLEVLNECNFNIGWLTALPSTENHFNQIEFVKVRNEDEEKEYLDILSNVLMTLDPAIQKVKKSSDAKDAYVIKHEANSAIIIQEGMSLSNIPILSSGTKYGINIANIIFSIRRHKNGIYLIDEQFSYINSEIETAILATMVSLLGPDEQLFFTTHNTNILSLSFPIHSFYFLNRANKNIEILCASEFENRNNISVKNLYDNDLFNTSPNVSGIYQMGVVDEK